MQRSTLFLKMKAKMYLVIRMIKLFLIKVKWIRSEKGKLILGQILLKEFLKLVVELAPQCSLSWR